MAERPAQPHPEATVWYLGWEIGWNDMAYRWANTGWDAYKGGCDPDAPRIQCDTFTDCLDEIEDYEEGE